MILIDHLKKGNMYLIYYKTSSEIVVDGPRRKELYIAEALNSGVIEDLPLDEDQWKYITGYALAKHNYTMKYAVVDGRNGLDIKGNNHYDASSVTEQFVRETNDVVFELTEDETLAVLSILL